MSRTNPVLLKPEADTRSQVVVRGRLRHDLSALPWRERGEHLWPVAAQSFDELVAAHELVLIEGAGSPAEINLVDFVNNRVVAHADAAALLVADIDRGGAFAHLFGTWSLVPETTRERLAAFVLNKFRGDATLLEPGPSTLTELTGMTALGVVPMLADDLPDEEGATVRARPPAGAQRVAVVRFPFGSNLDEFHLLADAAHLRFVTRAADLDAADLVILPGSKHVAADLAWLRREGFDAAIRASTTRGNAVIGICGGAMMLGGRISDPLGIEGEATGLDVLPLDTVMDPDKITRRTTVECGGLPEAWHSLEGRRAVGYEIRNGRVTARGCETGDARVWAQGRVLATTVHGLLEDPDVLDALLGFRPPPVLERTFDVLADAIDAHLDTDCLWAMVRG